MKMNSFSRKAISVGLVLATALWFAGSSLAPLAQAAGLSTQQVDSILSLLQSFGADQATINNVQAALTGQPTTTGGSSTPSTSSYTFTKVLTLGSKGADVTALQNFLNAKGYLTVSATGYFGSLTKAALAKFQAANSISPAAGYFGPVTMKAVNAMMGTTTGSTGSTGGTVVSGVVSVSLASDSPAAGTVVSQQAAADFAHYMFSNGSASPITVTSMTVARTGVSSDNSLLNVYLYVGNNRVTDGASLVNSQAVFTNSAGLFTIPANSTAEVSVRADVASSSYATAGQSIGFAVTSAASVVASGVTFSGTFPVQGNLMTVANVTDLAGVTMSGTPTGPGTTINAGTMNAILWSEPVSISQRTVYLKYARFRQIGSVQTDALQNIGLYMDGSKVATGAMNSDGTVVFDMTSSPVSLNTGSHTMEVHADVVKGTSRTFSFSLQTASDVLFTDSNYSVNITPTATFPMTTSQTTISAGSVSITTDASFTTNQTLSSASNVTLGQWTAKAYGEDVRVSDFQVQLNLTGTSTAGNYINNIAVYVNGAQVGATQNWAVGSAVNGSTTLTFGSGNLMTLSAGQQVTIAVKGDTSLATTTTAEVVTLIAPINSWQGLSSYSTAPATQGTYTGQTLTLTSGSLTVAANPAYSNQTLGSNLTKQEIASYILQASNVDSVQVTQVTVGLGGTLNLQNLSNLTVSGTGISNVTPVLPQSSNTFAVNFTIAPGQSNTINVYADVGNATGTVTSTMYVAARALTSQAQVGNSANPATGQTITLGNGTLNAPTLVQSQSLQSQYVIGGVTGQNLATYNVVATNGAANITEMDFSVSSASTSIVTVGVGGVNSTVTYSGTTGTVAVSGLNVAVPGNDLAGTNIPVTVNYAPVGPSGSASPTTSTLTLTAIKYTSGGTTVTTSTSVAANPVMLVASAPTISASITSNSGLVVGQNHLFDFTVGSQGGTIQMSTTTFAVSASGITTSTLTSPQLYVGSNPLSGASCTSTGSAPSFTVTCTFPASYRISGTGQTFSLYGTVGGTLGNAGQSSITTQLGAASTTLWSDVSGGSGVFGTSNTTFLYNYPTATWSVHN